MASAEQVRSLNMIAGADLRGKVYSALTIENDAGVAKVILSSAATDVVVGMLAEDPRTDVTTDGMGVPVAVLEGQTKCIAGAAITAGNLIVPDAAVNGRVVGVANIGALAPDSMAFGIALTSASDGDIFPVLAMTISAPHSA